VLDERRLAVIHDQVTQFLMNEIRLGKPVASVTLLNGAVNDGAVSAEMTQKNKFLSS